MLNLNNNMSSLRAIRFLNRFIYEYNNMVVSKYSNMVR